jgi:hypothetical protein
VVAAGIELGNNDPAIKFSCHSIYDRGEHPAGTAGGRKEIHHDRFRGLAYEPLEAGIIQLNRHGSAVKGNGVFAVSAFRPEMLLVSRNPVFCAAIVTGNDDAVHRSSPYSKLIGISRASSNWGKPVGLSFFRMRLPFVPEKKSLKWRRPSKLTKFFVNHSSFAEA